MNKKPYTLHEQMPIRLRKNTQKRLTLLMESSNTKLPSLHKSNQESDTFRSTSYQELLKQLVNKRSAKLVLKKIKQQKLKEDYNDLAKKVSLQREYAKKQQREQLEQKRIFNDMELCQRRIMRLSNDVSHVGLQSLKKLSKSTNQFHFGLSPVNSIFKSNEVENQDEYQRLIVAFIEKNKKFVNNEVVKIKDYEKKAPFRIEQFQFADKVLPRCKIVEKQMSLEEDNLKRNNLLLEKILLERMLLRENLI